MLIFNLTGSKLPEETASDVSARVTWGRQTHPNENNIILRVGVLDRREMIKYTAPQ